MSLKTIWKRIRRQKDAKVSPEPIPRGFLVSFSRKGQICTALCEEVGPVAPRTIGGWQEEIAEGEEPPLELGDIQIITWKEFEAPYWVPYRGLYQKKNTL